MTHKSKLLACTATVALILPFGSITAFAQTTQVPSPPPATTVLNDSDEIIATGTRSSIENSLDAKKIADSISDTLSADQADRFPDNNIGEALARIPGISFQRDNNTGDGQFISLRGLDSSFVTTTYNGLRIGTADEFRRSAYDNITGDNISSITVTKAPLPEHASEGIGGIVDIRTRGALERSERNRLGFRYDTNSFADKDGYRINGGFNKHLSDNVGVNFSAAYRKRYINSYQFDPATTVPDLVSTVTLSGPNGSLDFDSPGPLTLVPSEFIDISNFNTEQINYTHDNVERDQLTVSGNIDWEVSPSTKITIGGRHDETQDIHDTNRIEFDVDNDIRSGVNTWRDPEVNFRGLVEDEDENESRLFIRSETELDKWQINAAAGWSRAYRDLPVREINFVQELEDTPSSSSRSSSNERRITFAPFNLSIGNGLFPGPVPGAAPNLTPDQLLEAQATFAEAINPFCGDSCGEIDDYNFELEDSRENIRYTGRLDLTRDFSNHDSLENIKFGVQWERSEFTDRDIDVSFTDDTIGDSGATLGRFIGTDTPGVSALGDSDLEISDVNLITDQLVSFAPIGNPFADIGFNGIPQFDAPALRAFHNQYLNDFLAAGVEPRQTAIIDATENFYTAYLQAKWNFDKLDIIAGARIEQYEADFDGYILLASAIEFDDDPDPTERESEEINVVAPQNANNLNSTSNFEFLPRIALNYNVSDETKIRASYTTSIARPTFDLLAGTVDGDFDVELADDIDPNTATINDVTAVNIDFDLGNPELKNAYSHNFDISFEHYFDSQNAISVAGFYKSINDFIFTSFASDGAGINFGSGNVDPASLFADLNLPPSPGTALIEQLGGYEALANLPQAQISIDQALNGDKAEILGIEFGLFHTFDYLPGILSNFGFIGNATFTDSKIDLNLGTLSASDAYVQLGFAQAGDSLIQEFPFFNSPDAIYNATLFFDYEGLEANLSYRNSGVQLEEIEGFGISQFQQGRTFIDLDIEYTFKDVGPLDRVTFYFEANDLTDTGRKPSVHETRGKTFAFNDNSTFNGRSFRFGTRFRF